MNPIIKNKEYPRLWISKVFNKKSLVQNNLDKFIKSNFYPSIVKNLNLKSFFKIFENELIKFDEFVSDNIKINIQEINIDLTSFLNQLVDRVNKKIKKATPKMEYLRTFKWVSLSKGLSLKGMITSCTRILPQE